MGEVHEHMQRHAFPPQGVVLTFDDGFANFAEEAWPILHRLAFKATVFAVVDRIGQTADWLSSGDRPRLMNMATLRQLAGQGVEIGSHTLTHPRLAALPVTAQRREIADSKKKLEDSLGQAVLHFC
jgi:peptidoglycan/xylan/chitin deacetylase (PgdA/CDA1 family)